MSVATEQGEPLHDCLIAAAARQYHPDAWRLAATIASCPHIGPSAASRVLKRYREDMRVRQLPGGPALRMLIVERARTIKATRETRAARRRITDALRPLWERWPALRTDARLMEMLRGRIVWRAVEEMCRQDELLSA